MLDDFTEMIVLYTHMVCSIVLRCTFISMTCCHEKTVETLQSYMRECVPLWCFEDETINKRVFVSSLLFWFACLYSELA